MSVKGKGLKPFEDPSSGSWETHFCSSSCEMSPWRLIGDHDSAWSDSINRFLTMYEKEITGTLGSNWFRVAVIGTLRCSGPRDKACLARSS